MEFWAGVAIKLSEIFAWPLSIIIIVLLVRSKFQDIFLKHGGTELMLKSTVKEKLDAVEREQLEKTSKKNHRIVRDILEDIRNALAEKAEGSNADGWYRKYSNGSVVQKIRIPAGELEGKKTFLFPVSDFDNDCVQATIAGSDKPSIRKLTGQSITLELDGKNSDEIVVNILATSDL